MEWFESLVLAAVQGLTEFLPVSSSGHLVVFAQVFAAVRGSYNPASEDLFLAVMLHVGTLVAILAYYRDIGWSGARGVLGARDIPVGHQRNAVVKAGWLAVVATLPAVPVGLFLKPQIEAAFQSLTIPAFGFLITATILVLTTRLRDGSKTLADTTWLDALLIGGAQAVAILPGVSRSGSTIVMALALGFSRPWAVGFSLLMAVLAILGAAVLEIKDVEPAMLSPDRLAPTLVATLISGLVGYVAIVWLVRVVRSGRLWYFSVYLVLLATTLLITAAVTSGRSEPEGEAVAESLSFEAPALDRPTWSEPDSKGAGTDSKRLVDRSDPFGS